MTITEFLLARIAEDERDAESLKSSWDKYPPSAYDVAQVGYLDAGDPERVLAECEAKRTIVRLRVAEPYDCDKAHPTMGVYHPDGHADQDPVLRALASVYADHPDYSEDWRA